MIHLAELELWFDVGTDGWPLLMAGLIGLSCGLLGSVFLLRRAALLGDAVSHSVLPGIAAGLLIAGLIGGEGGKTFGVSLTMLWILAGALAAGLLAVALIETLHRWSRIKPDTAMGAVFPAFFAAGILFVDLIATGAHFDADCIFYGALELVNSFSKVVPTLVCTVLVVLFFVLCHKEVLVSSFDPALGWSMGMRVSTVNWVLVGLLALTVVCAFEAVGAILVIALLIIPPATAYLLADRFHHVVLLSALFGVGSGVLGCWLTIVLGSESIGFETARAPTMAVVAGCGFLVALLFAPRRGLVSQYRCRRSLRHRILDENVLGALFRLGHDDQPVAVGIDATAAALGYDADTLRPSVRRGVRRGEIIVHGEGTMTLAESGRVRVARILRAHRLWEMYLHNEMGAPQDHLHAAADEIEHYLQPALVEELDALLEHPSADPHGKEIPGI